MVVIVCLVIAAQQSSGVNEKVIAIFQDDEPKV